MSEEESAILALERAVEWQAQRRQEQSWQETMRQCEVCRRWVNKYLPVTELVMVCPDFNVCEMAPQEDAYVGE